MAIQFPCTHCKTILRIEERHIGKQARCPQCQTLNLVVESMQFPENESEQAAPTNLYSTDFSATSSTSPRNQQPHRAGLILALGIASLACNFCLIPSILAWILGKQDIRKMDQGIMDSEGRGMTQAGMIMGMVITFLFFLSITVWLLLVIAYAVV